MAFLKEGVFVYVYQANGQLVRGWENVHRMYQADAHMRSILFREETRWPGYYFRVDKPSMDNENWLAFCNCKYDKDTGDWTMMKKPVKYIVPQAAEHEGDIGG